ncbi:MAG: sensor histidine kinase [Pseudonocardiaceae bacterium]
MGGSAVGQRGIRTPPDHPWLLPALLHDELDADASTGRIRRTTRDWIVDVSFVLGSAGLAALTWFGEYVAHPPTPSGLLLVDLVLAVLAPPSLWLRRRWPVGLAVVLVALSTFSQPVTAAAGIAVATVAVHRRSAVAVAAGGSIVGAALIRMAIVAHSPLPYWLLILVTVLAAATTVTLAMFTRAQRQLTWSLADRARRAEAEQQLRVEQARRAERTRIAREMHDVLAHRISLLSMHAGALEFHPDASPEEVAGAAGIIRGSAHQALQDLREVIGVLRDDPAGHVDRPDRPQPGLADVAALVEESRRAGLRVELDDRVDVPDSVPGSIGRAAYRITQESLTNVRKHAPSTPVRVTVAGGPGDGLTLEIRNPLPTASSTVIPGAGTGLVGLVERASLAGGRLRHGPTDTGDFQVQAWLPWPQ